MHVITRPRACLPSCEYAWLTHYAAKLLIPCQHLLPRFALISFSDARMGPRQSPHAALNSGHLGEGLTNPPPLEVCRPRRLQPRMLIDLVFKLPQSSTLLPTCFTNRHPLPMNPVLSPLFLSIAHLPISKDACNLFAELHPDHRRVPLCLHFVRTRIMMIRLQKAYVECRVKL